MDTQKNRPIINLPWRKYLIELDLSNNGSISAFPAATLRGDARPYLRLRTLPHRQLRKPRSICNHWGHSTLPHRQLRKGRASNAILTSCTLPHRQLRKHKNSDRHNANCSLL